MFLVKQMIAVLILFSTLNAFSTENDAFLGHALKTAKSEGMSQVFIYFIADSTGTNERDLENYLFDNNESRFLDYVYEACSIGSSIDSENGKVTTGMGALGCVTFISAATQVSSAEIKRSLKELIYEREMIKRYSVNSDLYE